MGDDRTGLSPRWIRRAVEVSLRRLQTDRIDLYQSHDDYPATPLEDTLAAYGELIQAGKVRAIGAPNVSAARLAEALDTSKRLGLPRYEASQPLYNLIDREPCEAAPEPPIASATSVAQFEELAGAASLHRSAATIGALDAASAWR